MALVRGLAALALALPALDSAAYSTGITGQTLKDSATRIGCTSSCHGGTINKTLGVSLAGPSTLNILAGGNFSITTSGGTAGFRNGINVATNGGTLGEAAANLQISGGELTHTSAATTGTGATYNFTYTLPGGASAGQVYTIYGAARNNNEWNDAANITVTVVRANQATFFALMNGSASPSAITAGSTAALSSSGGSGGGAVSYASLSGGTCSVAGTTVTALAVGTCTVRATKALDGQYNSTFDDVAVTVNQGSQTINFGALPNKLSNAPPFVVSATGGGSGNPVTFSAAGVCSSSGTNGETISLTGMAGTCTITANQAGNASYTAAPAVMQAFSVADAGLEIFPPSCVMPPGWVTSPGALAGWSVATDFAAAGSGCSFKSNVIPNLGGNGPNARIQITANFDSGTISFQRRVSSEPDYKCFRVIIDGTQQDVSGSCTNLGFYIGETAIGASGELPFATVSIPIASGNHTVVFSYDKDTDCCVQGLDAAWVDQLSMPLSTSIVSPTLATGTFNQAFAFFVSGTNFPSSFNATGLPPGLTINTSTGLISGTPSAAGTYNAMVSVSNPAGVNPGASALQSLTIIIDKASQVITFDPLNNRLTTAVPFTVSAFGGSSGNPVTFTADGVCTASGTNNSLITLTGAPGTCTVTPNQAGNANYHPATGFARSFTVSPAAEEIFPPQCAMPAGWTNVGMYGWIVSSDEESTSGACSLRTQPMMPNSVQARTQFTGSFSNGTVSFRYRVSSEAAYDCFQFFIDGVQQNVGGSCANRAGFVGASGDAPWNPVSVPITAGTHTLEWRYDKDSIIAAFRDAVWLDEVQMPLYTLSVVKTGAGTGTVTSNPAGIDCGMTCSAVMSGTIQLTATPDPFKVFAGWSGGGCMGTGACFVTMDASKAVAATFNNATAPTVPQNVVATPGNGSASITFDPPASNGGSGITSYGATCTAMGQGTVFGSNTASPIGLMGMANGVQYTCNVTANNFIGASPAVAVTVTPRTVPGAPTGAAATAGNAQLSLSFAAPMSNGGAAIGTYTATCTSMSLPTRTGTAMASPVVVGMLTNGATYACSVVATNAAGDGPPSNVVMATPRTVPGTPMITTRVLDGRVHADIPVPPADNGSPITGYTLSCTPGPVSTTAASGPLTLTGLTNGTPYMCSVVATNAAGNSAAATFSATPQVNTGTALFTSTCTACHAAPPTVPQLNAAGTTATVLNTVIAEQPSMNADFYVTGLTQAERVAIATYLRSTIPTTALTTPFNTPRVIDLSSQVTLGTISFATLEVVTPPTKGTLSAFTGTTVTYTPNAGNVGADSFTFRGRRTMPSSLVGDARTVNLSINTPPAPVITSGGTASGTNGVAFSYQITASNGPTGYGATGLPNGLGVNAMTGLISGTPTVGGTFMATVSASNAGGPGSAPLTITLNPGAQTITFAAQSPATRPYAAAPGNVFAINPLATASSGLAVSYVSKTPAVCSVAGSNVSMLAAGTCTVGANQAGNASYTIATEVTRDVGITPILPGAPTIGMATAGSNQANIAFTAPSNTGGTVITGYAASCTPSGSGTGAVSPIVVGGLTNNTTYTCSVRASNSVGQGPASGTVMVTPVQTPTPPSITSANNATFAVNAPGAFSATASGTPSTFTWSIMGALPAGVTFNTGSGVLSGTPTVAGTFMLTLGVGNGVMPNASQAFTLTVSKAAQSINFSNPGTRTLGTGTVPLSAVATSGLAVSFVSDTGGICSVAGSNATLLAVGTCTIRAQQAGNANFNAAADVPQSFSVLQGSQSITFPAPMSPIPYSAGGTFTIVLGTASSGLAVTHASLTTAVCTLAGNTVTMVRAGICTIAANQAGNANYSAAAQVSRSVTLTGAVPGAPTLNTATAGDGKVTLAFTAPASDGGSSIINYTATCGAAPPVTGSASPIAVTGLMNGTSYSCRVTATNAAGTGAQSNALMATPAALPGATLWANSCGNGSCHGNPPSGTRLNAGGNTTAPLDFVIPRQPFMNAIVGSLTPAERLQVAQYIAEFIPAVNVVTPLNTAAPVDVGSQVFLNTAIAALTAIEVVTPPAHGTLSAFTGTTATYTPTPGYVGPDSFTYRAKNVAAPSGPAPQGPYDTDIRSVTISVQAAPPAITSALSVGGTVGQAFSYQIAASNAPTGYNATGLPGWLSVSTTTGVLSGTPPAAGSFPVTISASNGNGSGSASLTISVAAIPQAITFGAQASPIAYVHNGTVMIAPTATGGASGNPVVYGSLTPGVCSVSGATFTMLAAGVCTLSANQAGNATHSAAPQVTRDVSITGTAPGAPTIGTAIGGNTQATVSFTPHASNGGLPVSNYTVNCSGHGASAGASPITVSGLTNGVTYSCSVQASNAAGTSAASGTVMVTPVSATLASVVSRKVHGAAGTFEVPVNHTVAIGGAVDVEPRGIGAGHTIVFKLTGPATGAGAVTVAPAGAGTASVSGNEVIVTLTGIADRSRATVTVNGVNGGLTVSASLGFMVGDVNNNRALSASDISAIRALSGQPTDASNFRHDINATGRIQASDIVGSKRPFGVLP